jgi:hypothetical protein
VQPSRGRRIAVLKAVAAFNSMRHNLAAHRTRGSGGAMRTSVLARRWLPRYGDMFVSMKRQAVAVSACVRRCKPSLTKRRWQWSAARAACRLFRQSRKSLHRARKGRSSPEGQRLRFGLAAVPSFSVGPRCYAAVWQRSARKACGAVRRSVSPFKRMRHNLAAHADARGSGGALQGPSGARRWLPRWAARLRRTEGQHDRRTGEGTHE